MTKETYIASRTFNRKQAIDKEVKELFAKVSIGATGAPTLSNALGIASIERTSQGLYKLTLQDSYVGGLKFFGATLLDPDAEDITFQVKEEDVDGLKTISFFTKAAAVATDPSNGATLLLQILVKNISIK